jgi:hypothetical protein
MSQADVNEAQGEIVLAQKTATKEENAEATDPSTEVQEQARRFRYPLTMSGSFPNRIRFRAIEVEGTNIGESIGNAVGDTFKKFLATSTPTFSAVLSDGTVIEKVNGEDKTAAAADATTSTAEKEELATTTGADSRFTSYENGGSGTEVGRVTLPLPRDLRFSDVAQYQEANLGAIGGAAEAFVGGGSPFEGITSSEGLGQAATSLAAQKIAGSSAEIVSGGVGFLAGGAAGGLVGASLLGGLDEGLVGGIKSATRIASQPNQRTLFNQVNLRSFAFTFKMIANSEAEALEIKNIVKFFRQELYPEQILAGNVPVAYRFPNVFEIDILNKNDDNPAFKIQRCYLKDVNTSFNSTASGMYRDGSFIEVDVSLAFSEITALHKDKIRQGY